MTKKDFLENIIYLFVSCIFFWAIDSYLVNKQCNKARSETFVFDDNMGPRTTEEYSEEERQVFSIAMSECVYDISMKYKALDDEDYYISIPCITVAKDVVRAIFNPGTLTPDYTIYDVYEESRNRVVKGALRHGTIIAKDK